MQIRFTKKKEKKKSNKAKRLMDEVQIKIQMATALTPSKIITNFQVINAVQFKLTYFFY